MTDVWDTSIAEWWSWAISGRGARAHVYSKRPGQELSCYGGLGGNMTGPTLDTLVLYGWLGGTYLAAPKEFKHVQLTIEHTNGTTRTTLQVQGHAPETFEGGSPLPNGYELENGVMVFFHTVLPQRFWAVEEPDVPVALWP
jgi:hypothetical protein